MLLLLYNCWFYQYHLPFLREDCSFRKKDHAFTSQVRPLRATLYCAGYQIEPSEACISGLLAAGHCIPGMYSDPLGILKLWKLVIQFPKVSTVYSGCRLYFLALTHKRFCFVVLELSTPLWSLSELYVAQSRSLQPRKHSCVRVISDHWNPLLACLFVLPGFPDLLMNEEGGRVKVPG